MIIIRAIRRWWAADPATHGAALSYYAIFSLSPLFVILIVALGTIFGSHAVEEQLLVAVQSAMGDDVSCLVSTIITYAREPMTGTITAVLSIILTILGSLALFSQVERALAAVWKEDGDLAVKRTFLKTKFLAVLMIIILGLLII